MTMDLKDLFLATPMARSEYMRIHSKYFPPEIKALYMIDSLIEYDGYVYVEINKVVYGLKQAAVISYQQLVKHLYSHGYYPIPFTTGLCSRRNLKTKFCLCVEDFGINFSHNRLQIISSPHCVTSTTLQSTGQARVT